LVGFLGAAGGDVPPVRPPGGDVTRCGVIFDFIGKVYIMLYTDKREGKMAIDNWERNREISAGAERILSESKSPLVFGTRAARHEYVQQMRRDLVAGSGCGVDTAARHIGMAAWYRKHGLRVR